MQIWAESGKSALPICNYSQILYQFLTFTQNLKRSHEVWQLASQQFSPVFSSRKRTAYRYFTEAINRTWSVSGQYSIG